MRDEKTVNVKLPAVAEVVSNEGPLKHFLLVGAACLVTERVGLDVFECVGRSACEEAIISQTVCVDSLRFL